MQPTWLELGFGFGLGLGFGLGHLRVQRPCTRAQRLGGLRWREGRLRGSQGLAAPGGGRRGTERIAAVAEGARDGALVESARVHAA